MDCGTNSIDPSEAVAYVISLGDTRLRLATPRIYHIHYIFLGYDCAGVNGRKKFRCFFGKRQSFFHRFQKKAFIHAPSLGSIYNQRYID